MLRDAPVACGMNLPLSLSWGRYHGNGRTHNAGYVTPVKLRGWTSNQSWAQGINGHGLVARPFFSLFENGASENYASLRRIPRVSVVTTPKLTLVQEKRKGPGHVLAWLM